MEIVIDEITFEAAHYIPGHHKCGVVHGHTYHVRNLRIKISKLDKRGISIDFSRIKRLIKEHFDHRLIIPYEDEEMWKKAVDELNLPIVVTAIKHTSVEGIADAIRKLLIWKLDADVVNLEVYEGDNQGVAI